MIRRFTRALALAVGLAAAAPFYREALAQASHAPLAATVAVVHGFSRPGLAAVVRRLRGETIIAVKDGALSPELMVAALKVLDQSRRRHGENPSAVVYLTISGERRRAISTTDRARVAPAIAALRSAVPRIVANIGTVPAITVNIGG